MVSQCKEMLLSFVLGAATGKKIKKIAKIATSSKPLTGEDSISGGWNGFVHYVAKCRRMN